LKTTWGLQDRIDQHIQKPIETNKYLSYIILPTRKSKRNAKTSKV